MMAMMMMTAMMAMATMRLAAAPARGVCVMTLSCPLLMARVDARVPPSVAVMLARVPSTFVHTAFVHTAGGRLADAITAIGRYWTIGRLDDWAIG